MASAARIFLDLALDGGTLHNGIWIAALFGALPVIPYLDSLDAVHADRRSAKPLAIILLSITLLDSARVLAIVTRAAGCLALEHIHVLFLILPLTLAVLWCVCRNGDAVGYAAILWTRVFPALLLLVMLLQIRHYDPRWLFPLLGNGWRDIIGDGARVSGWFVPATAICAIADKPDAGPGRRSPFALPVLASAAAALLLALRLMMTPTGLYETPWLSRLDALLTNGRAPLYLQFPMILVFFISALHLLACEGFAASALAQRMLPTLDGRACAALALSGSAYLSVSGFASMALDGKAPWIFVAAGLSVALTMLLQRAQKGGERPCDG